MAEPTLAEAAHQIDVLETAVALGERLQAFTDFLADASGRNVADRSAITPTVKFERVPLKHAAPSTVRHTPNTARPGKHFCPNRP